jgi:RNA polymerase sigma-70 factor (ECF subfamily)
VNCCLEEAVDKKWFVSEIESYSGTMYRVARTILNNDEDCRDALQDAALKAWEKRGSLRDPSHFRTWMTRILINSCYDTRRKNRRIVLTDLPEDPSDPPDPDLAVALASLPDKFRLPLVLVFSEGMTYAEAAKALHIPVSTLRGRIHRGREQLRKELSENE